MTGSVLTAVDTSVAVPLLMASHHAHPVIGAWAVGGSTNLQITATVTNSGNIDNIAQVWTADQFDIDSTPANSVPAEDDQDNAALQGPTADSSPKECAG